MSAQEKTEQPTPAKLRKSREKGQVAMSRDLTSAVLLALGAGIVAHQLGALSARMEAMARTSFARARRGQITTGTLFENLTAAMAELAAALAPILVVIIAFSLFVPFLQVGALFTLEPLTPKLSKLNPIEGIKKTFFSLRAYIELAKSIVKIIVIGAVCWVILGDEVRQIIMSPSLPPLGVAKLCVAIAGRIAFTVALLFLGIAVIDVFYQRWQHLRDQRMTKEEVTRQYKDQEGDPQHKNARKQLHEEILQENMVQQVAEADVVIVNPTHVACALRYDPDRENAPRLVAKGKGWLAQRIREIAKEHDIPIIRNKSLAWALLELELDDQAPAELFDAVAEVLQWVEAVARQRGELPAWATDEPGEQGG